MKKRYQHFIPRFILKNFLSPKSYQIYDKQNKTFLTKGASNSMGKKLFYEHNYFKSNEIEDLLSKRESLYSKIIKKIIGRKGITKDEFNILLEFRHVSYYRSNEFNGFYSFKSSRTPDDWKDRWDWRSLNSITGPDFERQHKLAQLNAIKSVIEDDQRLGNIIRKLSRMTPICFLFTSKGKKFVINDNGSLSFGSEFDGVVIIVLSPTHALMFPRITSAVELMRKYKLKLSDDNHKIIYENIDDEYVNFINNEMITSAFEYYVDPNFKGVVKQAK